MVKIKQLVSNKGMHDQFTNRYIFHCQCFQWDCKTILMSFTFASKTWSLCYNNNNMFKINNINIHKGLISICYKIYDRLKKQENVKVNYQFNIHVKPLKVFSNCQTHAKLNFKPSGTCVKLNFNYRSVQ